MASFGIVKNKNNTPSPFEEKCVSKLANAIRKVKQIRKINSTEWQREFSVILKVHSKKEIRLVLDWYIAHIEDEYIPRCYSAKKFRSNFDRLVKLMEKKGHLTKELPISDRVKKIQLHLKLSWPGTEANQELQFLQLTFNYLESFFEKLKKLGLKLAPVKVPGKSYRESSNFKIVRHLLGSLAGPFELTCWHAQNVNHFSWNWPGYSGMLIRRALDDNNELWNGMLARKIAEYHGDGLAWEDIKKLLKEIK